MPGTSFHLCCVDAWRTRRGRASDAFSRSDQKLFDGLGVRLSSDVDESGVLATRRSPITVATGVVLPLRAILGHDGQHRFGGCELRAPVPIGRFDGHPNNTPGPMYLKALRNSAVA